MFFFLLTSVTDYKNVKTNHKKQQVTETNHKQGTSTQKTAHA